MPVYKYYLEIKNRFFLLSFSWFSVLIACYLYKEVLLFLFVSASSSANLSELELYFIFTDVTELFNVYLKLIFFISNQLCVFMLLYHLLMFLVSGLYETEYNQLKQIFKVFLAYWVASLILLYKFVVPFSWLFFLSFQQGTEIKTVSFFFEAKIIEYFNFFIHLYYVCLLSFQLLAISTLFINNLSVKITQIKLLRKFFYFGFVILSTITTPPDVFSQIIVSGCLIFSYELILFTKIVNLIK